MRARTLATLAAACLATLAAGCSDDDATTTCTPGTLRLQVELTPTADTIDSFTVESLAPPLPVRTVAHKPGTVEELLDVDLVFPGGYPDNRLVTLLVTGLVQGQPIDRESVQVHTRPGCTVATASLVYDYFVASQPDDGGTD